MRRRLGWRYVSVVSKVRDTRSCWLLLPYTTVCNQERLCTPVRQCLWTFLPITTDIWWAEAGDAATQATMHRMASMNEEFSSGHNVHIMPRLRDPVYSESYTEMVSESWLALQFKTEWSNFTDFYGLRQYCTGQTAQAWGRVRTTLWKKKKILNFRLKFFSSVLIFVGIKSVVTKSYPWLSKQKFIVA